MNGERERGEKVEYEELVEMGLILKESEFVFEEIRKIVRINI